MAAAASRVELLKNRYLPEDIALVAVALYFGYTDLPMLMKLAGSFFGMGV